MIRDKYRVMDAHCHVYPAAIAARAVAGTDHFYDLHSVYDGTVEDLLEKGAAAGVDHFVVQSVATSPKQVGSINEFIAATVAGDSRLTGLGTLHPDSPDLRADFRHIQQLGLKGVKLHPDIQQFKIDDYRCLKIYELCEEAGLPILLHTGDSRYDYSNTNRLLPVMEIYTGLTVVGAHLAGWSVWDEACDKLGKLPNLYMDCSSCFAFMPRERAAEIIRHYGADRVLYGTDYPMWSMEQELDVLLSLGFSEAEYRRMLWDNAYDIFMK
ncbi:MAG: amidohydrolase family protein [Clostridia bacterium]|nr:amidohydrolase family protein [Clostridia bacterium]